MSSDYPDTPKAILDQSLPINTKLVDYDRNTEKAFAKIDSRRCVACQWQNKLDATVCERCGYSTFEEYMEGEQITFQADGVSAHFRTKVTECKKTAIGPMGKLVFHPLKMKQRLVVSIVNNEAHRENFCETCGRVYTWEDGRAATDEEMKLCREGKIPEKGVHRTGSERWR